MNSGEAVATQAEVVFVDTRIDGYEAIIAGVGPGAEVVMIDAGRDGFAQMAEALAGRNDIQAIHVVGHGDAGVLMLGSTLVRADDLDAYADELGAIGRALTADGDIQLWGCRIGAGAEGQTLIQTLARITGADIAASDDLTGAGGDWVLETQTGAIEASFAMTPGGQAAFAGALAVSNEDFDNETFNVLPNATQLLAGDWRFTSSTPLSLALVDQNSGYVAWIIYDEGDPDDKAVVFNYDGVAGARTYSMGSNDGSEFALQSVMLGQSVSSTTSVSITGYYNGVQVVAPEVVNLSTSDSTGGITYSVGANDGDGRYGTLNFNSSYSNIDEIRFAFAGSADLHVDQIVVASAVADVTAPVFASAAVNGATLVMTYTEASALDAVTGPAAGQFAVTAGGASVNVNSVAVNSVNKTVTLTLQNAVTQGQAVTVAYSDPTGGNDVNAIQDLTGNDAASLSATSVTNNTVDVTAPVFASAAVNGATLVMTYTEATTLDAANPPSAGLFAVTAGGASVTVNSVAVNAVAKTVTLTLQNAVTQGQAVTVAYSDPTGGNDVNAIQDVAGNDAASLSATSVTNNTADVTAPVFASAAVSGATLVMTYTEANTLDAANPPSAGLFAVTAGGASVTVNSVAVNAVAKTVTLTLQNAVTQGQAVTVAYSDPTGGNDANAIQDVAGNDAASLSATSVTNNTVDATSPSVSGNVTVPANGAYAAGATLNFTVAFDENVIVAGTDSELGLTIGSTARSAAYASKSANSITYSYTVQAGDTDANGVAIGSLTLGATTIQDAAGNDANLSLSGHLPSTAGVLVDTTAPEVASVSVPSNAVYAAGATLSFIVTFDENVTVTGSDSTLGLTIGSTSRTAAYASNTANSITYSYTVQAGEADADGVTVGGLTLNSSTIRDAASNHAALTLNSVGSTAGVLVDTTAPAVTGNIAVPSNGAYGAGQTLNFTVTFDANVTVTGTDSALGLTIGATARTAAYASKTANSITYTYTVQAGDADADGVTVGAISLGATTVRDAAGNNANLTLIGHIPSTAGVLVDAAAPAFVSASVNGATLVLNYADAGLLDATHAPGAGAFTVMAGGAPTTVTGVSVNGAGHTVTLTLASPFAAGAAVTVAYADPSGADDVNAIQDLGGNDAPSLTATTVTNNTPAPTPTPTPEPPAGPTEGADVLTLPAAGGQVFAGAGADTVTGGDGGDYVQGNQGDDRLNAGGGADTALGGQGDDFVHGNQGDDMIYGDLGDDSVAGGQGSDLVHGGQGDDVVLGDLGNDSLLGGQGADAILGGVGDDYLSGDRGDDILTGGAGRDAFNFRGGEGRDTITDFNAAEGDRIWLPLDQAANFEALASKMSMVGADTVITLGAQTIVLTGVSMSSIKADDFIFT